MLAFNVVSSPMPGGYMRHMLLFFVSLAIASCGGEIGAADTGDCDLICSFTINERHCDATRVYPITPPDPEENCVPAGVMVRAIGGLANAHIGQRSFASWRYVSADGFATRTESLLWGGVFAEFRSDEHHVTLRYNEDGISINVEESDTVAKGEYLDRGPDGCLDSYGKTGPSDLFEATQFSRGEVGSDALTPAMEDGYMRLMNSLASAAGRGRGP